MTNMKKNVTINGINCRLCGHLYIPYSPELPELKGISEDGTLHYLYLRLAHPDQLKCLEKSGMLMQYLRCFDRKAKRYMRNRRGVVAMPSLDDPNFEDEYRKHVLVARNTDSNLISKFILQGVHQDILLKLLNRNATPTGRKEAKNHDVERDFVPATDL